MDSSNHMGLSAWPRPGGDLCEQGHWTVPVPEEPERFPRAFPSATDLGGFRGKRVLCILDEENIRISLKNLGLALLYGELFAELRGHSRAVWAYAVFSAPPGERGREASLRSMGWRVLAIPQEIVPSPTGPRKVANADVDLSIEAGSLLTACPAEAFVIGTGDGDLAVALARGARRLGWREVFTLSVPGSTSSRLRPGANQLFTGNLLVGLDLVRDAGPVGTGRHYRFGNTA